MIKILLPTDFSDNAWSAIVYALKLYEEEICTFYLLNSTLMRFSTMSNLSKSLMETIQKSANQELIDLKEQILSYNPNTFHQIEIVQSSEDISEAIEWAVRKYDINLVVMGTKGVTGAKEFFIGSNTNRVISRMHLCPILIVPNEHDFIKPWEIAFPTDFNRPYSEKELKPLEDLAKLFSSAIRVIHINVEEKLDENQENNMKSLDGLLAKFEHSFHWMPKYTNKADEINVFIQELEIEMLAMVNYEHSLIERITREPVIKKIGFYPIVPFLVIPE